MFAAAGLRPFAQMAFVTPAAEAPAAPTGPGGPDDHLANTTNVIRHVADDSIYLRFLLFIGTFLPAQHSPSQPQGVFRSL